MVHSLMGFRGLLGISAVAALLSSCDNNGWCDGGSCNATPPGEISLGLVAGNFNGNGHTSIVATTTSQSQAVFTPGTRQPCLSTGAGAFASLTVRAAGDDPLYLASADLVGNRLP